jgi:hypothetical protein
MRIFLTKIARNKIERKRKREKQRNPFFYLISTETAKSARLSCCVTGQKSVTNRKSLAVFDKTMA